MGADEGRSATAACCRTRRYGVYWFACSTGGRQRMKMAQRCPEDCDGIVAGAPAIHCDRFQTYQIWPQVVMRLDVSAPIPSPKLMRAVAS